MLFTEVQLPGAAEMQLTCSTSLTDCCMTPFFTASFSMSYHKGQVNCCHSAGAFCSKLWSSSGAAGHHLEKEYITAFMKYLKNFFFLFLQG